MDPSSDNKITVDPVTVMQCEHCKAEINVQENDPFSAITCPSCSSQQVVPARFGPFLLLNLINTGGMGCVYLGKDEGLGRLVAIKVMLSSLGEDTAYLESFRREAQAAARLNHPNIAQIYSFGQERGQPYIVMELVSGQRFDRLISETTPLEPAFVVRVGMQIAEGLQAADEIGLLHGDIKPENILLDEKMNAKLVDFGIASFATEQRQLQGIWGTPYYIAPEKIRRQRVDVRSDIYSLGATLFHALTGKPPFDGPTPTDVVKARLDMPAPTLSSMRPGMDPQLENLIARMLQQEPALRYPNYKSLLGDMKTMMQAMGPQTTASGRMKKVVFKKKGGASPATEPEPEAESSSEAPRSGTRLVIRKPTIGKVSISPQGPGSDTPAASEPERPKRPGVARRAGLIVLLIFVVIGGVLGWIAWRHARAEVEAVERARRKAKLELAAQTDKAAALFKGIQASVGDIVRASVAPRPHVETADRLATVIFSQSLTQLSQDQAPANPDAAAPPSAENAAPPAGGDVTAQKAQMRVLLASVGTGAGEHATKVAFARDILAAAEATSKDLGTITTAQIAADYVESLQAYTLALRPLRDQMTAIVKNMEKNLQQAQDLRIAMQRILDAQRVVEEKQRKEEEHKAKIAAELAKIDEIAATCKGYVDAMNFAQARTTAAGQVERFETVEGREAGKSLVDRYAVLAEWKAFLIASITKEPFRWGWFRSATVFEDILAADDNQIKIRTGTVPWTRVQHQQLVRIVEHYLQNPSVLAMARARGYLATAIWFSLSNNPTMVNPYVSKAVSAMPSIQREVDRLLPATEEQKPADARTDQPTQ
jgi:serine/threonine protein kinase